MRRLIIVTAVILASAAPARAELVQLKQGQGASLARRAGAVELVPELRIWRVDAEALVQLRRARAVAVAEPERLLRKTRVATQGTDPLVPDEWWRAAIGADRIDAPGPGTPVTVVDSGLDITHPEFASRPNTVLMNKQTVSDEDEDHGDRVRVEGSRHEKGDQKAAESEDDSAEVDGGGGVNEGQRRAACPLPRPKTARPVAWTHDGE